MPPKGRKGTSAVTKEDKVEKVDSDSDSEKESVETKQSPSTKVSAKKEEEASDDESGDSSEENVSERKSETKKKSYKADSEEEEAVPKKRASQRTVDSEEEEAVPKKRASQRTVDSEEEEAVPKKRASQRTVDSEEDEETVPQKRASQRTVKTKAKVVDVSDEDEEDEEDSESEESEDEYVPPYTTAKERSKMHKKKKGYDSDYSGDHGKKAKRSNIPKRKAIRRNDPDVSEGGDSDVDWRSKKSGKSKGSGKDRKASSATPTRRAERATRGRPKAQEHIEEEDEEEDEDEESDTPSPKSKAKAKSEDKEDKKERKQKSEEAESEGDEEDDSDEEVETKEADSKRANGRKDKNKSVDNENGMVEEEDEEEDDDDEKEESKPAAKRKGEKFDKATPKKAKEDNDPSTMDFSCDKKTPDGKRWNLKISTWNVAGLRSLIRKNGLEYLTTEKPDILCIQEIKCPEKKLPSETKFDGYHSYWSSGDKDGHYGTGLYSKVKPIEVTYGIGNTEFDSEGRMITAEYEKFYVVNAYVPNSGRGLVTLPKRMKWDTEFRNYLKKLDVKKPVILCGDLNVSHQPIDLANPKTNTKTAGFTQEERDGFTKLLEQGFVDSFRHLYPDKTDAYTFWTNMKNSRERNVGWRLDYFVLSKRLLPNLCENSIRKHIIGSDHCPVTLFINI